MLIPRLKALMDKYHMQDNDKLLQDVQAANFEEDVMSVLIEPWFNTLTEEQQLFFASVGLSEEVGEVLELIKKQYILEGKITDKEHFVEELGDVLWHVCILANMQGISLEEVMEYNMKKFRIKHPDRYRKGSEKRATNGY